jgi:hypothetical protein
MALRILQVLKKQQVNSAGSLKDRM